MTSGWDTKWQDAPHALPRQGQGSRFSQGGQRQATRAGTPRFCVSQKCLSTDWDLVTRGATQAVSNTC